MTDTSFSEIYSVYATFGIFIYSHVQAIFFFVQSGIQFNFISLLSLFKKNRLMQSPCSLCVQSCWLNTGNLGWKWVTEDKSGQPEPGIEKKRRSPRHANGNKLIFPISGCDWTHHSSVNRFGLRISSR
jgi:hypothetical protein